MGKLPDDFVRRLELMVRDGREEKSQDRFDDPRRVLRRERIGGHQKRKAHPEENGSPIFCDLRQHWSTVSAISLSNTDRYFIA